MRFSILIVSHNRKVDLRITLKILYEYIEHFSCEVLVLLDGCTDGSELLMQEFSWVDWHQSEMRLWASPARNLLFKRAKGDILIGFDDDAHPLQPNFLDLISHAFNQDSKVGILAFEEVRGLFSSDQKAIEKLNPAKKNYYCSEFVGCGFAIKSDVYQFTRGFPVWMDIYGEEGCVAIEVLDLGYQILRTNNISVNHRVDKIIRAKEGKNYFRFKKQLRNEANYFIVYYPIPFKALLRLFWNNFKNYALKDFKYFYIFTITFFKVVFELPRTLRYRFPVKKEVIIKKRKLAECIKSN